MRPISIIITTNNEEAIIGRTLDSVQWADDILIVDSFSTDDTLEIVEQYPNVRTEQRAYTGPADQKNWAIPNAKHEWVLLLDADEVVTIELQVEIKKWLATDADLPFDACWIYRNNFFLDQQIKYSGWQNDKVVRFFHRDRARYYDVQVHEEIDLTGLRAATLTGRLNHYTYKSFDHFLDKTRRYARWSAQDHDAKTEKVTWFHLAFKPLFRFVKHFFIKQGFRDRKAGFIVSVLMAWGVFLRYAFMVENRKTTKK